MANAGNNKKFVKLPLCATTIAGHLMRLANCISNYEQTKKKAATELRVPRGEWRMAGVAETPAARWRHIDLPVTFNGQ